MNGVRARIFAMIAAAGLTVACGSAEPTSAPPPARENVKPADPPPGAPPALPNLTADGFGPLRIGMTLAEVVAAYGPDSDPEAVGGPDTESCDQFRPERAPPELLVMIEEGRLTRISLISQSPVQSDRGVRIGDSAAAVRSIYGPAVRAEPHKYADPPAEYLTVWVRGSPSDERPGDERGIRYEIGEGGTVSAIHAGGSSIEYVEGCL